MATRRRRGQAPTTRALIGAARLLVGELAGRVKYSIAAGHSASTGPRRGSLHGGPTRALQAARPLPASPRELPSLLASYVDGSSGKRAGPSGTIRSGNTTSPMARLQGEKGARQRRLRIAPCGVAAEGGALSARHRVRRRACWSSPTISRRVVHNRARASSASRLSRARRARACGVLEEPIECPTISSGIAWKGDAFARES